MLGMEQSSQRMKLHFAVFKTNTFSVDTALSYGWKSVFFFCVRTGIVIDCVIEWDVESQTKNCKHYV